MQREHLHPRSPERPRRRARRTAAATAAVVASLLLAACGSDERSEAPVTAPDATPPPTTAPTPPPTTAPPVDPTSPPSSSGRYETIRTVIEDADGARLCFVTLESLPPQCGTGIRLAGWSWDAIDVERVDGDVTWVDQIYVAGTYDAESEVLTVDDVRVPTEADRDRILMSAPLPDHDVPCDPPAEGWPTRTGAFPLDRVAEIDGYAGSWSDPTGQVMVVAVTGDLAAAEAAVRELDDGGLCIVQADRSADELADVQGRLAQADGIELLSSSVWVDASGEWVEAEVVVADPELQATLDAEFGEGVVRLQPQLLPLAP